MKTGLLISFWLPYHSRHRRTPTASTRSHFHFRMVLHTRHPSLLRTNTILPNPRFFPFSLVQLLWCWPRSCFFWWFGCFDGLGRGLNLILPRHLRLAVPMTHRLPISEFIFSVTVSSTDRKEKENKNKIDMRVPC